MHNGAQADLVARSDADPSTGIVIVVIVFIIILVIVIAMYCADSSIRRVPRHSTMLQWNRPPTSLSSFLQRRLRYWPIDEHECMMPSRASRRTLTSHGPRMQRSKQQTASFGSFAIQISGSIAHMDASEKRCPTYEQ